MTLEERAEKCSDKFFEKYELFLSDIEEAYKQGANEQKEIDIENGKKFCKKWLDEIIRIYLPILRDEPYYAKVLEHTYKVFEKAMEE